MNEKSPRDRQRVGGEPASGRDNLRNERPKDDREHEQSTTNDFRREEPVVIGFAVMGEEADYNQRSNDHGNTAGQQSDRSSNVARRRSSEEDRRRADQRTNAKQGEQRPKTPEPRWGTPWLKSRSVAGECRRDG